MLSFLSYAILFLALTVINPDAAQASYLIAEQAIPVFNTAAAAEARKAVKPDACGQVRQLEFVALPGTAFSIKKQYGKEKDPLFEVTTSEYKAPKGVRLYISGNGLKHSDEKPGEPARLAPSADQITKTLRNAVGIPYIWAGNLRQGVDLPEENNVYAGLDCSGLLYEATEGHSPRNSSDLVSFGKAVPVAGLTRDQILKRLKPLDIIVWKGHVIIVLNRDEVIESVLWCGRPGNGGVVISPLRNRLGEIMVRRKGADKWPEGDGKLQIFVIRRWI